MLYDKPSTKSKTRYKIEAAHSEDKKTDIVIIEQFILFVEKEVKQKLPLSFLGINFNSFRMTKKP